MVRQQTSPLRIELSGFCEHWSSHIGLSIVIPGNWRHLHLFSIGSCSSLLKAGTHRSMLLGTGNFPELMLFGLSSIHVEVVWIPIEVTDAACDSAEFVPETCSVVAGPFVVGLRNHQEPTATAATGISFMNNLLLSFTSCPAGLRCCQVAIFFVIEEGYLHHS